VGILFRKKYIKKSTFFKVDFCPTFFKVDFCPTFFKSWSFVELLKKVQLC